MKVRGLAWSAWEGGQVQKAWGKLSLIGYPRQDNLLLDMYLAPHVRTLSLECNEVSSNEL